MERAENVEIGGFEIFAGGCSRSASVCGTYRGFLVDRPNEFYVGMVYVTGVPRWQAIHFELRTMIPKATTGDWDVSKRVVTNRGEPA